MISIILTIIILSIIWFIIACIVENEKKLNRARERRAREIKEEEKRKRIENIPPKTEHTIYTDEECDKEIQTILGMSNFNKGFSDQFDYTTYNILKEEKEEYYAVYMRFNEMVAYLKTSLYSQYGKSKIVINILTQAEQRMHYHLKQRNLTAKMIIEKQLHIKLKATILEEMREKAKQDQINKIEKEVRAEIAKEQLFPIPKKNTRRNARKSKARAEMDYIDNNVNILLYY